MYYLMRTVSGRVLLFLFIVFMLLSAGNLFRPDARASEPVFEPGFTGSVQVGVGVASSKSNSEVNDDNERIDSLDQGADSETDIIPVLLWEMTYTTEGGRTQLFAGTPGENIIDAPFLLEAGIRYALRNGTILSAALTPGIPVLEDEVWADPFLTGADRRKTDREVTAFRLGADDILGSPFFCTYGFATQDIDDEKSGEYLISQGGLTTAQARLLKRDADFHRFEIGMALPAGKTLIWQPSVNTMLADADGDANSFNNYGGGLTLMFNQSAYRIFASCSLNFRDYDAVHPVFNKTREDTLAELSAGVTFPMVFGFERVSLTLMAGWSVRDSNIGFYDAQGLMGGMAVAWHF